MTTKLLNQVLVSLLLTTLLTSCEKDNVKLTPLSSLTITNAVNSGQPVRLGSSGTIVNNNSSGQFGLVAGDNKLYVWPTTDSAHPYYNQPISTGNGEIFSLFLSGDTTAVDAVVVKDNIPYHTDSTFGVRFINLSSGSSPVKVTLSSSPTASEFGNVAYKQISDFKSFPALAANTDFTFEVRIPETDSVLTTTSLNGSGIPKFKNITLVYRGPAEGPVGITRVNNY